MKKTVFTGAVALLALAGSVAYGQNDRNDNRRYDDRDQPAQMDDRRRNDDRQRDDDRRSDDRRRNDSRFNDDRQNANGNERRLRDAYQEGFEDGQREAEDMARDEKRNDYKNVTFGLYGGLNSTRFQGEDINGNDLTGRLGYQAGFLVRAGGRVYGQLGLEYFATSSNFFRPGDGQKVDQLSGQIDTKYLHIPVYVGFKLAQSRRGISGVRLQVGAEYANNITSGFTGTNDGTTPTTPPTGTVTPPTTGTATVQINNAEIKSGSFNALGQLGFDFGPLFIDITYHHGLENVVNNYANSQRRILGANLGFKF
jgi:Ni/Co efflux regulator RcnB